MEKDGYRCSGVGKQQFFYKDVKEDKGVVNSINTMATRSLLDSRLAKKKIIGKQERLLPVDERERVVQNKKKIAFDVSLNAGWRENGKLQH